MNDPSQLGDLSQHFDNRNPMRKSRAEQNCLCRLAACCRIAHGRAGQFVADAEEFVLFVGFVDTHRKCNFREMLVVRQPSRPPVNSVPAIILEAIVHEFH